MKGFIYLIHAKGTNLYKIGLTTRSAEARLKELNGKQSPHELVLRHSIEVDDVNSSEKYFHRMYRNYNHRNEWFKFSKIKVFGVVRSMNSYKNGNRNNLLIFMLSITSMIFLAGLAIDSNHGFAKFNCLVRGESCRK